MLIERAGISHPPIATSPSSQSPPVPAILSVSPLALTVTSGLRNLTDIRSGKSLQTAQLTISLFPPIPAVLGALLPALTAIFGLQNSMVLTRSAKALQAGQCPLNILSLPATVIPPVLSQVPMGTSGLQKLVLAR